MNKELDHYVYVLEYKGKPIYIGSGRKSRINHVFSGCSHNKYLNEWFFYHDKELASLRKVREHLSKDESIGHEFSLILEYRPILNIDYIFDRPCGATEGYLASIKNEFVSKSYNELYCQDYD